MDHVDKNCRTWCLLRNSFDNDEDMILRRTEDGAEKWCLRDLRREDETSTETLESAHLSLASRHPTQGL